VTEPGIERAIEAVWRAEFPRIVAGLARRVRDVDLAEQLAQDAFVAALEQWPQDGIPAQPGAWLTAAAQRRAIDAVRRDRALREKLGELDRERRAGAGEPCSDPAALAEQEIADDLLRMIFRCCHPLLAPDARAALTLRLCAGLTTDEIARSYLVPEATVAQRIVRSKRALAEQQVPFDLPGAGERRERLASVLEVLYLVFNEGYAGTGGADWTRPDLCNEGLRLCRVLAELLPDAAEVHGLLALMELQGSRLPARSSPAGDAVLLADQDRARWDRAAIERGLAALGRARALGGGAGSYALQAEIAACHARAPDAAATPWPRIVELYGELLAQAPSPVVALNRAVAVAMAFGPGAGLILVDELAGDPQLAHYHLLPSVRGDLLARLLRFAEAQREFVRAAALARNERERALLLERAAWCARTVE
jgi:RNA polymerase sigma-70 factor (ECF subfamily)